MGKKAGALSIMLMLLLVACVAATQGGKDPGVRGEPAGAGGPLPGLTSAELAFFQAGLAAFLEVEEVKNGLGPRFNFDTCSGCHSQPAIGGTSPSANPQIKLAKPSVAKEEPLHAELKSFLGAVRTRSKPVVALEDGRQALALALDILNVIRTHAAKIQIDYCPPPLSS